jgi:hypothetical protein
VAGLKFVEGCHAEQAHGALDLSLEDLDSSVDTLAPAGHQTVDAKDLELSHRFADKTVQYLEEFVSGLHASHI